MKLYLNPRRWICTNIKLHDAVTAQKRLGGVARNMKSGHHSKKKKKL
jgi:hypothetical protein